MGEGDASGAVHCWCCIWIRLRQQQELQPPSQLDTSAGNSRSSSLRRNWTPQPTGAGSKPDLQGARVTYLGGVQNPKPINDVVIMRLVFASRGSASTPSTRSLIMTPSARRRRPTPSGRSPRLREAACIQRAGWQRGSSTRSVASSRSAARASRHALLDHDTLHLTPPPAASDAASALLLLLREWRVAALLTAWREARATERLLATLRVLLPRCQPAHWMRAASRKRGERPEGGGGGGGTLAYGGQPSGRAAGAAAAAVPPPPLVAVPKPEACCERDQRLLLPLLQLLLRALQLAPLGTAAISAAAAGAGAGRVPAAAGGVDARDDLMGMCESGGAARAWLDVCLRCMQQHVEALHGARSGGGAGASPFPLGCVLLELMGEREVVWRQLLGSGCGHAALPGDGPGAYAGDAAAVACGVDACSVDMASVAALLCAVVERCAFVSAHTGAAPHRTLVCPKSVARCVGQAHARMRLAGLRRGMDVQTCKLLRTERQLLPGGAERSTAPPPHTHTHASYFSHQTLLPLPDQCFPNQTNASLTKSMP
eukprot:366550-Chlamydomonas_euryale.AAC.3